MSEDANNQVRDENIFPSDRIITVEELAEIVVHDSVTNKLLNASPARFSLFLGAGASKSSKIKLSWEMIKDFVETIFERERKFLKEDIDYKTLEQLENKLTKADLPINNRKNIEETIYIIKKEILKKQDWYGRNEEESEYSKFFKRCFPKGVVRRDYIKKIIEPAETSWGYIQLANLLERGVFKNILTTNFDDMVYQVCTSFTKTRPIVFSYSNLSTEIIFSSKRPQIFKLHGDFLYTPLKNLDEEIDQDCPIDQDEKKYNFLNEKYNMRQAFEQSLQDRSGIVVIGYAGADNSIMKIFHKIPKTHYLLWCIYWDETLDEQPLTYGGLRKKYGNNLVKLLKERDGFIVKTNGFEDIMSKICNSANISHINIITTAIDRIMELRNKLYNFVIEPNKIFSYIETEEKKDYANFKKDINRVFLASSHFFLGYDASLDNKPSEAENHYQTSIAIYKDKELKNIDKNLADVHYNYGNLLADELNKPVEAEKNYREAIKLNPTDAYAYNRLGALLTKTYERVDEAEKELDKAIKLNPDFAFAYYNHGNWFLKKYLIIEYTDLKKKTKFLKEAQRLFEQAAQINPTFIHNKISLSTVHRHLKIINYKVNLYKEVKNIIPKDDYYNFGCFYWVLGKEKKATDYLSQAINEKSAILKHAESDLNLFDLFEDSKHVKIIQDLRLKAENSKL